MVVISHTPIFPENHSFLYFPMVVLNRIGWAGVDLFFVLSGFLVGGLLFKEYQKTSKIQVKRFFIRRAFKVWPGYFAFLLVYCTFQILRGDSTVLTALLPNFFHVQNYFSQTSQVGWLWSLGVEEHFYLILPLALGVLYKLKKMGNSKVSVTHLFLFVAITCLVLRALTYRLNPEAKEFTLVFPSHLRFDSLFAGVFLSYLVHFKNLRLEKLRPFQFYIFFVSVALGLTTYFYPDKAQMFLYPFGLSLLYVAFSGIVLFAHFRTTNPKSVNSRWTQWLFAPFVFIGVRSYAIYVWHGYFAKPIANRITATLGISGSMLGWKGILFELIYLGTPIFLGALMFLIIEEPALKIRNKLFPSS